MRLLFCWGRGFFSRFGGYDGEAVVIFARVGSYGLYWFVVCYFVEGLKGWFILCCGYW